MEQKTYGREAALAFNIFTGVLTGHFYWVADQAMRLELLQMIIPLAVIGGSAAVINKTYKHVKGAGNVESRAG